MVKYFLDISQVGSELVKVATINISWTHQNFIASSLQQWHNECRNNEKLPNLGCSPVDDS